jgi:hypothetical protein
VSASGQRRARGREQATCASSSPPCSSPGGLLVGGEAVTAEIERSDGRARVRRWRSWSSAARVSRKGARSRWRRGLKRPRKAALACGPSRGAARLEPELGGGSVRPEVGVTVGPTCRRPRERGAGRSCVGPLLGRRWCRSAFGLGPGGKKCFSKYFPVQR